MKKVTPTSDRKLDHIQINLDKEVSSELSNGLERFRFIHEALPNLNLSEIDPSTNLFGKKLSAPILISSMTGGAQEARRINNNLASGAITSGIAMGVGSQRAAIEDKQLETTYQIRSIAPNILLFANLGAIQLNYGYGIEECERAVSMIGADALVLHFNALQEAIQPEGNTDFNGLLSKVQVICKHLSVPVIAKEVGWGVSGETAKRLADAGVSAIDVSGAGGTSWSQVELHRATTPRQAKIAASFRSWGIKTADSIIQIKNSVPEMILIASGGIRNGIEIAKCICLGASLVGIAGPFLKAASESSQEVENLIEDLISELKICMFVSGASNISQLENLTLLTDD